MSRSSLLAGLLTFAIVAVFAGVAVAAEPTTRPATRPAAPATGPVTIRVLTYNIHHGATADEKPSLEAQAKIIRDADPDFVMLQEVDRKTTRVKGVDQLEKLKELTGLKGSFGKTMDFAGGEYGNALLTKHHAVTYVAVELPGGPKEEPRNLFRSFANVGGTLITFAGTHLNHRNEAERIEQAKAIVAALTKADRKEDGTPAHSPTLLAGDFNARPDSPPLKILTEHFKDVSTGEGLLTSPADKPRAKIDYVLAAPADRWRVKEAKVLDEPTASDHRPVLVVLELLPAE